MDGHARFGQGAECAVQNQGASVVAMGAVVSDGLVVLRSCATNRALGNDASLCPAVRSTAVQLLPRDAVRGVRGLRVALGG